MSGIRKIFLIVGTLLLIFIVWDLIFNQGGILSTAYDALISPINITWEHLSGSANPLLPPWNANPTGTSPSLGSFGG